MKELIKVEVNEGHTMSDEDYNDAFYDTLEIPDVHVIDENVSKDVVSDDLVNAPELTDDEFKKLMDSIEWDDNDPEILKLEESVKVMSL